MFRFKNQMLYIPGYFVKAVITTVALGSLVCAQPDNCQLGTRESLTANAVCHDVRNLRGTTYDIPSNITSLDQQGIGLCSPPLGDGDIVYVMDNSGSMAVSHGYIGAVDTSYYFTTSGCASTTASGTITIQQWNAAGTALVARTITRLASNTGCAANSGDPFNARGRAFRLGIQSQGNLAPNSYAGIMSFTTTVGNIVRPLTLNTANVNTLINGINAVSSGGTDYTSPLDTGVAWLRTASVTPQTPGRNKAIIFLSDGQPGNTNYLPLDPLTPPIYGIFMGKDTLGTGRLRELSMFTGGLFYLIPPTRPDSLNRVILSILNFLTTNFDPIKVTFTNNTLVPPYGSTTYGFIPQTGATRWRMVFDNRINLLPNTANRITMTTEFRDTLNSTRHVDTIPFVLNTVLAPTPIGAPISNSVWHSLCSPVNQPAQVWFSDQFGFTPVSVFPATTTQIYAMVKDNAGLAGTAYRITLTGDVFRDQQTFNLTESSPGIFSAIIPIDIVNWVVLGDGRMQMSRGGDMIHMVFTDPVFGDIAIASASFPPPPTSLLGGVAKIGIRKAGGGQVSLAFPPGTSEWRTVSLQGQEVASGFNGRETLLPRLPAGLYVVKAKEPGGRWIQTRFSSLE